MSVKLLFKVSDLVLVHCKMSSEIRALGEQFATYIALVGLFVRVDSKMRHHVPSLRKLPVAVVVFSDINSFISCFFSVWIFSDFVLVTFENLVVHHIPLLI